MFKIGQNIKQILANNSSIESIGHLGGAFWDFL